MRIPDGVLVAVGGGIGAWARFWLSGVAQKLTRSAFPVGTMTVNILGSFFLGLVLGWTLFRASGGSTTRVFLGIGILGGFTTFSTFVFEAMRLLQGQQWSRAGIYVGGQLVLSLLACWAGWAMGRFLT